MKPFCSNFSLRIARQKSGSLRSLKSFKMHRIITIITTLAIFGLTMASQAQELPKDSLEVKKVVLDEVFVSAIRVTNQTPVTFSNLSKEQIKPRNLGQDIPILMNFLPSVVTTSDAGAGVGYTGLRIRGSDASRINTTINGIPYNDSESQGVFCVDLPDFASSAKNVQIQRGGVSNFEYIQKEKLNTRKEKKIQNLHDFFNLRNFLCL